MAKVIRLCAGPEAPIDQRRGTVYLPIVAVGATPSTPPDTASGPAEFYRLLTSDKRQQRVTLTWCESLAAAARWKAADIVDHDYWQHQASNGEFANKAARRFGCKLPEQYHGNWNGIESLAAGSPDAAPIFASLAASPGHAAHLFGRNDFFRQQWQVGIAMAAGGRFGYVWCVLIAPCGGES